MKNVLITGGTGFVGQRLSRLLVENGYRVTVLSRKAREEKDGVFFSQWDLEKLQMDSKVVLESDYIIHLAGENIGEKKWSKLQKKQIVKSRVKPLEMILDILKGNESRLKVLVSASGVNIYNPRLTTHPAEEQERAYDDFLAKTCIKWEKQARKFENFGVRVVRLRTAVVLGKESGLIKKVGPLFKWGLGAVLGSGKQSMPWIHIDDLCNMYMFSMENNEMQGAYNAAINDGLTQSKFAQAMASVYEAPLWLPHVPGFLLRWFLGKRAKIILEGRAVQNEKVKNLGFVFRYENINEALQSLEK